MTALSDALEAAQRRSLAAVEKAYVAGAIERDAATENDYAQRRKARRTGRQKGCTVYIPAEQLQRSGLADRWPLFYRVWGGARGRFVVVLYEEA